MLIANFVDRNIKCCEMGEYRVKPYTFLAYCRIKMKMYYAVI